MGIVTNASALQQQFETELTGNILPFWLTTAYDASTGGLHGAITHEGRVADHVPRSAVLIARALWTFAAASRAIDRSGYRDMANRMALYLRQSLWDPEYGGLYWDVDRNGTPLSDRKHHYAQAFGIYGLSEHVRATGDTESLALAVQLFELLEDHAYDSRYGGYLEGSTREWQPLNDPRLSNRDHASPKSMNTLLHLLEAYTNLLRIWDHPPLRQRLRELLDVFAEHVFDSETGHYRQFFALDWTPTLKGASYGHDIEASWLLCEAADTLGDAERRDRARTHALITAEAVLDHGIAPDGSLLNESHPKDDVAEFKHWWPQAEAIVGFTNAYQLSADARYADAALRCWDVVKTEFVDRAHGDWFKRLHPDGTPDPTSEKTGPWNCPYHHSRACLEMMTRLAQIA